MTSVSRLSLPGSTLAAAEAPMYDKVKQHEIKVLAQAGFSIRQVARRAHVDRNTVRRVLREEGLPDPSPSVGRPPVAKHWEPTIQQILKDTPDLPTVEVLRRLREQGYSGSKNPVYDLVRDLRRTVIPPIVRFEGLVGEFSQHDFGQVRLHYDNGEEETLHFFASRLKWSRWVHVQITSNEQVESLARALLAAFESFGGVPLACVFDNPKTVVLSRYGQVIEWNPTFAQVAIDYRFITELCTPRRGQEKGSVENLVGFVKKNFFLVRRFHDRADVEAQLLHWLHEVNHTRPSRATGLLPVARIEEERRRLRPLPIPASDYALRFPVRVGPMATVPFQGAIYSMPAEATSVNATLFLYRDKVRIRTDRLDEIHPRKSPGEVSILPRHATSALAALMGRRAELYYKRQRLLEVGPPAEFFLTNLVHAHPRTWAGDVKDLFDLWLEYGQERLGQAFQQALDRGWFSTEPIKWWLQNGGNA